MQAGLEDWVRRLVSGFSSMTLLVLGALGRSPSLKAHVEPEVARLATAGDAALVEATVRLMAERRLWLDPDLTLARIARRIGVPAKALSGAINRVKGENVSGVDNSWRIAEACRLMQAGASVTEAMLGAGFTTKSNFNRDCLRVGETAPNDWLNRGS